MDLKHYKVKNAIGIFLFLFFISCHKDKTGIEVIDSVSNIKFKDFDNKSYQFTDFTDKNKGILLFGFAKWCGSSRKELTNINKIDSIYSDKIAIIGIDCENINDTAKVREFIQTFKISFPITKDFWNKDFDKLLFPDSVYNIPRLVLIDKNLRKVYFQNRYLNSTVDSIAKYLK